MGGVVNNISNVIPVADVVTVGPHKVWHPLN